MIMVNVLIWVMLILFFVGSVLVFIGTFRKDEVLTTEQPQTLVVVVCRPGDAPQRLLRMLALQKYPADCLQIVTVTADDACEEVVREAALQYEVEIVCVLDAQSTVGSLWVARMVACCIPGVALVRCCHTVSGGRGLDTVLMQSIEIGLTGLGVHLKPARTGFAVLAKYIRTREIPRSDALRFTRLQGTVISDADSEERLTIHALSAWYRKIAHSPVGMLLVIAGGGVLTGMGVTLTWGWQHQWQFILIFFYMALLFGSLLPVYLRGVSLTRQSHLLGGVVPHALRWCLLSIPALLLLLFSRQRDA